MTKTKMKAYENFMNIKLSNYDKSIVYDYFLSNYDVFKIKEKHIKDYIYSKILIRCKNEDDYNELEELLDEFNEEAYCYDSNDDEYYIVLYTDSDIAFNDCCTVLKDFNCEIYQFVYDDFKKYEYEKE